MQKHIYINCFFLKKKGDFMKGTKFILSPEFQPFSLNNTIFGIKRTRRIMKGNIVFVGIPFDLGTTYRSGARFAPFKIREMSRLISGVDFFLKKIYLKIKVLLIMAI